MCSHINHVFTIFFFAAEQAWNCDNELPLYIQLWHYLQFINSQDVIWWETRVHTLAASINQGRSLQQDVFSEAFYYAHYYFSHGESFSVFQNTRGIWCQTLNIWGTCEPTYYCKKKGGECSAAILYPVFCSLLTWTDPSWPSEMSARGLHIVPWPFANTP